MPTGGWNRGIPHSQETKEKIRQKALGRKMSENTRLAILKAHLGSKHSESAKQKMREKKIGKSSITDEGRKGIIASNRKRCKEKSSNWKGGKMIHSAGYKLIRMPEHYRASKNGYVFEHILIWERIYNKKVPKGYVIHHLNGIKDDNRPENLCIISKKDHMKINEKYKKRIRELELEISRLKQLNFF